MNDVKISNDSREDVDIAIATITNELLKELKEQQHQWQSSLKNDTNTITISAEENNNAKSTKLNNAKTTK